MAEPVTDAILQLLSQFNPENASQFLTNLQNLAPQAINLLDGVNNKLKETSVASNETSSEITSVLDSFKKLGTEGLQYISNLTTNLSAVNPALVSVTGQVGLLIGALTGILPTAEGFKVIGKSAKDATLDISGTIATLSNLPGMKSIVKPLGALLELGQPAKDFESGLIKISAEAGSLGDLFSEVGTNLEGMSLKTLKFNQQTSELGNAAGLSSKQISEYAVELMKIPGAIDQIVTVSPGEDYLSYLDAALKTATGTGQDFNSVVEQTSFMFQELGLSGKPVLENITRISEASSSLRIQLGDVRDFTRNAALNFKYLGDNTQASISVLDRFGGALQQTGLGNRAILETTKGVIDSISKMSVAQNAFLSSSTGGPGGLQGAFKIDLLKSQGKMDEVFKLVEQSLKQQFGGRIVTLQEGAENNQLAGQLMKQVALLTEGPTKIAGSKEEAYKILEAMQKGLTTTQVATGEQAFKKALETGDKIQERQYNQLVIIENELQKMGNLAALSAYSLTRMSLGSQGDINKVNIRNLREQASQLAAAYNEKTSPDEIKDSNLDLSKTINTSFQNLQGTVSSASSFLTGIGSNLLNEAGKTATGIVPSLNLSQPPNTGATLNPVQPNDIKPEDRNKLASQTQQPINHVFKTVCENCMKDIAIKEIRREGSDLIQRYDSGTAVSAHTGVKYLP